MTKKTISVQRDEVVRFLLESIAKHNPIDYSEPIANISRAIRDLSAMESRQNMAKRAAENFA